MTDLGVEDPPPCMCYHSRNIDPWRPNWPRMLVSKGRTNTMCSEACHVTHSHHATPASALCKPLHMSAVEL